MIEFYSADTPSGHSVQIMLEEIELPYTAHYVDVHAADQFDFGFLKISPSYEIPALVDHSCPDGVPMSLFGSGVILIYLAERTGCLLPGDSGGRYRVLGWLMLQVASATRAPMV
jgi:GST-like protein